MDFLPNSQAENATIYRMVEHQEQASTMELVDSLEKQALLEELLEAEKPNHLEDGFSYLIATPFRYPPLPWGSRFGTIYEQGIFYAGYSIEVVTAEIAYYLFCHMASLDTPHEQALMLSRTSFEASLMSCRHSDLLNPLLGLDTQKLMSPDSYEYTHKIGAKMREQGIQSFSYPSARHKQHLPNIGVFDIHALDRKENGHRGWDIKVQADKIQFLSTDGDRQTFAYHISDFRGNTGRLIQIPFA